jgi:hypothetical protein
MPRRRQTKPGDGIQSRCRNHDSAIVEQREAADMNRLPDGRQRAEHHEIPDEQLQQERRVADELRHRRRHGAQRRILGQASERQAEPKACRQPDRQCGNDERVQQADEEGAGIAFGRIERNQAETDVEASGIPEKAEARMDPAGPERKNRHGGERRNDARRRCIDAIFDPMAAHEALACASRSGRHGISSPLSCHWKEGENSNPPSRQRRFRLFSRGMTIAPFGPRLRSYISP